MCDRGFLSLAQNWNIFCCQILYQAEPDAHFSYLFTTRQTKKRRPLLVSSLNHGSLEENHRRWYSTWRGTKQKFSCASQIQMLFLGFHGSFFRPKVDPDGKKGEQKNQIFSAFEIQQTEKIKGCHIWRFVVQIVPLWMTVQPFLSIKEEVKNKNGYTAIQSDTLCTLW